MLWACVVHRSVSSSWMYLLRAHGKSHVIRRKSKNVALNCFGFFFFGPHTGLLSARNMTRFNKAIFVTNSTTHKRTDSKFFEISQLRQINLRHSALSEIYKLETSLFEAFVCSKYRTNSSVFCFIT